jgi:hypothetical protein
MGCTRDQLVAELSRLGAKSWSFQRMSLFGRMVCPTPTRRGSPTLAWQFIFALKDRRLAMARDRFNTVAGNLRSLTLAIEAMRQLERHSGSTMMERALQGFAAIAPPDWKRPWREVFGAKADWSGDITALYREKARHRHPNAGGSDTLMAELNVAYAEARRELGSGF